LEQKKVQTHLYFLTKGFSLILGGKNSESSEHRDGVTQVERNQGLHVNFLFLFPSNRSELRISDFFII